MPATRGGSPVGRAALAASAAATTVFAVGRAASDDSTHVWLLVLRVLLPSRVCAASRPTGILRIGASFVRPQWFTQQLRYSVTDLMLAAAERTNNNRTLLLLLQRLDVIGRARAGNAAYYIHAGPSLYVSFIVGHPAASHRSPRDAGRVTSRNGARSSLTTVRFTGVATTGSRLLHPALRRLCRSCVPDGETISPLTTSTASMVVRHSTASSRSTGSVGP